MAVALLIERNGSRSTGPQRLKSGRSVGTGASGRAAGTGGDGGAAGGGGAGCSWRRAWASTSSLVTTPPDPVGLTAPEVDAQFPGQPPGRGRSRHRPLPVIPWRLHLFRRRGGVGRYGLLLRSGLKGHQHVAHQRPGPDLDKNIGHGSGKGAGDFHGRLVGLDFQDDVAFPDGLAGGDRNGEDLRFMNPFAEIRQPK